MNMMVVRYGDDMIAIDAGLMFPEAGLPGSTIVVPDLSFLADNRDKLRAIVLTHGHEDHIGPLPFVLKTVNPPIYGTRFTLGAGREPAREHGLLDRVRSIRSSRARPFQIGPFRSSRSASRTASSIASRSRSRRRSGTIIHTGDFKVDETPVDGAAIDLGALSTRSATAACSPCFCRLDERRIAGADGLGEVGHPGLRGYLRGVRGARSSSPASHVDPPASRSSSTSPTSSTEGGGARPVDAAERRAAERARLPRHPRRVDGQPEQAKKLPANDEVVVLASGCQGEPVSAMARIAVDAHSRSRSTRATRSSSRPA